MLLNCRLAAPVVVSSAKHTIGLHPNEMGKKEKGRRKRRDGAGGPKKGTLEGAHNLRDMYELFLHY